MKQNLETNNSIVKVNEGKYVEKRGELYFVFEKVNPENKELWKEYLTEQKREAAKNAKGTNKNMFDASVNSIRACENSIFAVSKNKKDELWFTYVTTKDVTDKSLFPVSKGEIEMACSVMTNKDIPFTTHIGIFRAVEFLEKKFISHKDLAMQLHSFAAKVVNLEYANKEYMITNPMKLMREIMVKNLESSLVIGTEADKEDVLIKRDLINNLKKKDTKVDFELFNNKFDIKDGMEYFMQWSIIRSILKELHDNNNTNITRLIESSIFGLDFENKDSGLYRDLVSLEKNIQNSNLTYEEQSESLKNIATKWCEHNEIELKNRILNNIEYYEEPLKEKDNMVFGKQYANFKLSIDQDNSKIFIVTNGQTKTVETPRFFEAHNDLQNGHTGLMVMIDLAALAKLNDNKVDLPYAARVKLDQIKKDIAEANKAPNSSVVHSSNPSLVEKSIEKKTLPGRQ